MGWSFERVAGPFELTEGPVWDGDRIRFTDIPTSTIYAYDPSRDVCEVWHDDTDRGNGLALGPDGELYGCEMGGRRVVRYRADGVTTTVVDAYQGDQLNSPNDLAFDRRGRLWFTDPDYDDRSAAELALAHKSVYRCEKQASDRDWTIERMTHDTTNPNGLAFSPDGSSLYVAQSEYGAGKPRELRAYPVTTRDTLGDYAVLHDFGAHRGGDGMCVTDTGNLVVCAGWERSGPGPLVYVFTPQGQVLETHPYPGAAPTNCCFGGDSLGTIYVTGYDGSLWRASTDRHGLPIPPG